MIYTGGKASMFNIAWLDKGDVLKNEVEEFIKNSADDIEYNLFIYHGIKELFFNSYIDFNLIIINQNINSCHILFLRTRE